MATADQLIADARKYTGDLVDQAADAMDDAIRSVEQVGFIRPEVVPIDFPEVPDGFAELIAPDLPDVDYAPPAAPGPIGTFQDLPTIDTAGAPSFSETAPSLTLPSAPNQLPGFTESAPAINTSFAFPDPPSQLMQPMIADPVIPTRVAPDTPNIILPGFTAIAPTDLPAAPTDLQGTYTTAYNGASQAMIATLGGQLDTMIEKVNPGYKAKFAKLQAQLDKYLNGGTGLNATVENAIYERERDKLAAAALRDESASWSRAADAGFTMPSLALTSAAQAVRQGASDNYARAGREITVMQAEMEQKNLQFAVTMGSNLYTTLLSASISYHQNLVTINGQALQFATGILNAIVEMYNTAVKAFEARLDAYRAEAQVYETRLKASMAGIELYRAQIQALVALTNVDRAQVDIYRARIDALGAYANIYRAQIDAVLGRASLEKMKLEVFQTKVQAYGALVQAKNGEWAGYGAAIEGQTALVKVYSAKVDAFQAQTQAYGVTIDAKAKAVQAIATSNDARARQYAATVSGYSAVVSATSDVARTKIESKRLQLSSFQAQAQAQVARSQIAFSYYSATSDIAIKKASQIMDVQRLQAEYTKAYSATIAQLGTANAQVFAGAANAAMAGQNSLASYNTSSTV